MVSAIARVNRGTPDIRQQLLLAAIPLGILVLGAYCYQFLAPIYSGPLYYDQDPAYQYLLNGLSILSGYPPGHIDHPGTPLQLFVAAIVPAWALLTSRDAFDTGLVIAVLNDPEHYIRGVSLALLTSNALCLLYAGKRIFLATGSVLLAMLFQLTPLFFSNFAPRLVYLSPEALLFAFSVLTVGILAPRIFAPAASANTGRHLPKLAGITLGLGVATKLTFLPLIGLLLLFWERKKILTGLMFALAAFAVAILPIWTQLAKLTQWVTGILSHTGRYGGGEAGFIDPSLLFEHIVGLIRALPLYFPIVGALAAVLFVSYLVQFIRKVRKPAGYPGQETGSMATLTAYLKTFHADRVLFVLLLVLVIQTLITLKHYASHYMLPALPVAIIAMVWLLRFADSLFRWKTPKRALALGMVLVMLAFLPKKLAESYFILVEARAERTREVEMISAEINKYPDPVLVGTYRCSLPQCALEFAFSYTLGFRQQYAPAYLNNYYAFNIWSEEIYSYAEDTYGWHQLDLVQEWLDQGDRAVLLVSPAHTALAVFETQLLFESMSDYAYATNVYRIIGIHPKP